MMSRWLLFLLVTMLPWRLWSMETMAAPVPMAQATSQHAQPPCHAEVSAEADISACTHCDLCHTTLQVGVCTSLMPSVLPQATLPKQAFFVPEPGAPPELKPPIA